MSFAPNPRRRPQSKFPLLGLYPMELSRNLKVDSVARLEPAPLRAIDVSNTVRDAVEAMRTANTGCLIITERGRIVGIFTERDLLTRVLSAGQSLESPIRDCMTANPITVAPQDSVRTAIKRMQKGGYRHLPVVNESGRPVGILSARRVVHYLVEHFPALVFNLPPEPNKFPETPEGA